MSHYLLLIDDDERFCQNFKTYCSQKYDIEVEIKFSNFSDFSEFDLEQLDFVFCDYFLSSETTALDVIAKLRANNKSFKCMLYSAEPIGTLSNTIDRDIANNLGINFFQSKGPVINCADNWITSAFFYIEKPSIRKIKKQNITENDLFQLLSFIAMTEITPNKELINNINDYCINPTNIGSNLKKNFFRAFNRCTNKAKTAEWHIVVLFFLNELDDELDIYEKETLKEAISIKLQNDSPD